MIEAYVKNQKNIGLVNQILHQSTLILTCACSFHCTEQSCKDNPSRAIRRYGKSKIMKDDQGRHFASAAFTEALKAASVQTCMDGKGAGSTMYSSIRYPAKGSTRRNNCRRIDNVSQVLYCSPSDACCIATIASVRTRLLTVGRLVKFT